MKKLGCYSLFTLYKIRETTTYYKKSKQTILNRAKDYYKKNKERLRVKQEINTGNYLKKKKKRGSLVKINTIICLKKINKD